MILSYPEAIVDDPKFDQVINCQHMAQIGSAGTYAKIRFQRFGA